MPSAVASSIGSAAHTSSAFAPFFSRRTRAPRRVGGVDGSVFRDRDVVAEAVVRKRVAGLERRVLQAERLERGFADNGRAVAPARGGRADPQRACELRRRARRAQCDRPFAFGWIQTSAFDDAGVAR